MVPFQFLEVIEVFGNYLRVEYLCHALIMPLTNRNGISTWAWCPSLSSKAVVSFSSPKTSTHSPKERLVVMRVLRISCLWEMRSNKSSPPARSKGTNPSSSRINRSALRSRRCNSVRVRSSGFKRSHRPCCLTELPQLLSLPCYDTHGNLPALEAVLEELESVEPDLIVVGGDVVAGPMPTAVM